MNKIINVLTIISAVFLPLTLITGIYGMNFKFMPELNLYYGYPLTIAVMFIIVLCGIIIFKIKNERSAGAWHRRCKCSIFDSIRTAVPHESSLLLFLSRLLRICRNA